MTISLELLQSPVGISCLSGCAALFSYWVTASLISPTKFEITWALFINHAFLGFPLRWCMAWVALEYSISMTWYSIACIPLVWLLYRNTVHYIEFCHYWWHRILHLSPLLYKNIHYYHHRPAVDSGWLAEDRHPIEHAGFELIHTFGKSIWLLLPAPFSLLGCLYSDMVYSIITVLVHQDSPSSHPAIIHHQRHHWYITSNFGGSPRWDTYFGTMAKPNFAWESKMSKTAVSVQQPPKPNPTPTPTKEE